jgi:hypothetical protein
LCGVTSTVTDLAHHIFATGSRAKKLPSEEEPVCICSTEWPLQDEDESGMAAEPNAFFSKYGHDVATMVRISKEELLMVLFG